MSVTGCKISQAMTPERCLRNQRDAQAYFGAEAAKFGSCPCDRGVKVKEPVNPKVEETIKTDPECGVEEKKMSKVGTCRNCGRVMTISGDGLDGRCYQAAKGLVGEEREKALAEVKGRVERGEVKTYQYKGGSRKRNAAGTPAAPLETKPIPKEKIAVVKQNVEKLKEKYRLPEERIEGVLLETSDPQTVIPVTLRLTIEIAVRVSGITA